MHFEWIHALSTGIGQIDDQHKMLIKQVNVLLDACDEKKGSDEIDRFLRFLAGYVRVHFGDEERLMAYHDYPGREEHMRQHREFRQKIEGLSDNYKSHAIKEEAVAEAVRLSTEWFITHIRTDDIEMARHFRDRAGK